jgi:hypothetical protein
LGGLLEAPQRALNCLTRSDANFYCFHPLSKHEKLGPLGLVRSLT